MASQGGSALPVYLSNGTQIGGSAQPVVLVDASGTPLVNVTVSSYIQTLLDEASALAARTVLVAAAAIPFTIPIRAAYSTQAWTDMPAALTEFNAMLQGRTKADLTNATQARMVVKMMGTAGAAAAELRAQYSTDDSTFAYLDGATGPSCAINVNNTTVVSSWVNLAAGAKADVFLRVVGIGGDGGIDPTFGNISIQVR